MSLAKKVIRKPSLQLSASIYTKIVHHYLVIRTLGVQLTIFFLPVTIPNDRVAADQIVHSDEATLTAELRLLKRIIS